MMRIYFDTKLNRFNKTDGEFFPLPDLGEVTPKSGDTLTVGESWNSKEVARLATSALPDGLSLKPQSDYGVLFNIE